MSSETLIITIFFVIFITGLILVIIRGYLQWKILKKIIDLPEDQKPLAGLSKNTRAAIALILIAIVCYGSYLKSERKADIRFMKHERTIQAKEDMYNKQHPTDDILNYEFVGNRLVFRQGTLFIVPEILTDFCPPESKPLWSPLRISSDGRYLDAQASCFVTTPDAASSIQNSPMRLITIDLQENVITSATK